MEFQLLHRCRVLPNGGPSLSRGRGWPDADGEFELVCYIQTVGGTFLPKVSVLPKTIIHPQNVYRLIRPERLRGLTTSYFCQVLEDSFRGMYSEAELFELCNSTGRQNFDGLQINIVCRDNHPAQFKLRKISRETFVLKYPDLSKLVIAVFDDVSGLPETAILRDVVSVPLEACLSRAPDLSGTNTVYAHTFTNADNFFGVRSEAEPTYVGVTNRGWAVRWQEHVSAARAGSPYRFHEAIRRFGRNPVFHEIIACGASREEAMRIEEWAVDRFSLHPKGFNMIPGGDAGIAYLANNGVPRSSIDWEHREKAIRIGVANALISALWRDDDYATSVICGNSKNYDLKTVRQIRALAKIGKSPDGIAALIGCSVQRVQKLLKGETYSRVA
jgi:hypothetical protein